MSGEGAEGGGTGGLIRTFVRHPTAANLLMALILVAGFVALSRMNTQFFPDFGLDVIQVSVTWPGASAEDIDGTVVQALEPEVRFLDGVKQVTSSSVEGRGVISIEFAAGTDMQAALSDVETAVGAVTTLPESSERPVISRLSRFDTISRIVLSGPFSETALKALAEGMRDDLLARGVDKVDLVGVRDEEIWVEIEPRTLRHLGITLADIARQLDEVSLDLPAGGTRGGDERQVRALGLAETAQEVSDLAVLLGEGRRVPLGNLAEVSERFDDQAPTLLRDGRPAVELHVQRALNADALELADIVDAYLGEIRGTLPPTLVVELYDVRADLIRSRIGLLLRNGLQGLALVLTILLVFLSGRVAFWVASGIFVALMGTLAVMLATGQSLNMVSLFALIMVLGIVVDDAIVVAEHAESRRRLGLSAVLAAERGARRMAVPVLASSLTTLVAFAPLLLVSDVIGQVIEAIPLVVMAALLASLVECFYVLPGHLRGALRGRPGGAGAFRRWFDARFDAFRDGAFRRLVVGCVRWRYTTVAVAAASIVLALGMVAGGRVGFVFFVAPEADRVYANIEMAAGTPRAGTEAMLAEMQRALEAVEREITDGGADGPLVVMALGQVGGSLDRGLGTVAGSGDNLGSLAVEFVPVEDRAVTAIEFIARWRAEIRPLPGLREMSIRPAMGGPPGADVDVRLFGGEPAALKAAAAEVAALLQRYPGISSVDDDLPWGKEEVVLSVTPGGRRMGFTTQNVARQLRDSLEGAIAKRFPRGDEEVVVRVMLPRRQVPAAILHDLYLRAPDGTQAPLSSIVEVREQTGFARIRREDGRREVSVTAELDTDIATNDDILDALQRDGVAEIARRHGVDHAFKGKAEEQRQTFGDLRIGGLLALAAIFIILAWVFGSYAKPLVVMAVIPLGFVGAVLGHWLLGYQLSILSIVALVGLSGVLVNDAIILVSTIKEKLDADTHETEFHAIVDGARERLRAVILTSLTTIGGLTPMLFETDLQARFLIPMAITIVFGLIVSTLLVLLVVPALIAILADLRRLLGLSSAHAFAANADGGEATAVLPPR